MDKVDYRALAEECVAMYPCSVVVFVNPNYYLRRDKGSSICELGVFGEFTVDKLTDTLKEVSKKILEETGDIISDINWLDVYPEDMSLLPKSPAVLEESDAMFD